MGDDVATKYYADFDGNLGKMEYLPFDLADELIKNNIDKKYAKKCIYDIFEEIWRNIYKKFEEKNF
jgi:hypothetical protein